MSTWRVSTNEGRRRAGGRRRRDRLRDRDGLLNQGLVAQSQYDADSQKLLNELVK
jgi:hypothetical protein